MEEISSPERTRRPALLALVAAVFLLRLLPTLFVQMPVIFGDEYLFASMAENFARRGTFDADFAGAHRYLPGYPLFLAPAFLFPVSRRLSLALAMAVNALLGASAALPAYAVMRRRVSHGWALGGAAAFSLLPGLFGYQPHLFSENLFFPLLVWVIDLFERAEERPSLPAFAWLGLSAGLAAATRPQGWGVALAVLALAGSRPISATWRSRAGLSPARAAWCAAALLLSTAALPFLGWVHDRLALPPGSLRAGQTYSLTAYAASWLRELARPGGPTVAARLFFSDVAYLAIGSFLFLIPSAVAAGIERRNAMKAGEKRGEILAGVLALLFLAVSVVHQFRYSPGRLARYLAFGRYIDPILLFAFLFGFPALVRRGLRLGWGVVLSAAVLLAVSLPYLPEKPFCRPPTRGLAFFGLFAQGWMRSAGVLALGALVACARLPRFVPRILLPLGLAACLGGSGVFVAREVVHSRRLYASSEIGRRLAAIRGPATIAFDAGDKKRGELKDFRWRTMWLAGGNGHRFGDRLGASPVPPDYVVSSRPAVPGGTPLAREEDLVLYRMERGEASP